MGVGRTRTVPRGGRYQQSQVYQWAVLPQADGSHVEV
jgi:hypothetical protein